MIFPTDEVIQLRRGLYERITAGEITDEEAFRQGLQADPDDIIALEFLTLAAADRNDPQTEQYARELVRMHPSSHQGYLVLGKILNQRDPESQASLAFVRLAFDKMQNDERAVEHSNVDKIAKSLGLSKLVKGLSKEEMIAAFSGLLERTAGPEPEDVTRELEPHRLISQLLDSWDTVLDHGVVSAILENGEACAPLLHGILKEWGHELLSDDDLRVVERALTLLGEIGDLTAIPAILEFLTLDEDEDLFEPARWAFQRLAWSYPEATLAKICEIGPSAGIQERITLAYQLGVMPDVPGRIDAVASLLGDFRKLDPEEQDPLLMSAIVAALAIEGRNSPLASSLEKQYPRVLSRESRLTIRDLRNEAPDRPFIAGPPEVTIYQICCEEPPSPEENEEADYKPQPITRASKPGRNDPCWCGSGKKYKKCHLEQDERP